MRRPSCRCRSRRRACPPSRTRWHSPRKCGGRSSRSGRSSRRRSGSRPSVPPALKPRCSSTNRIASAMVPWTGAQRSLEQEVRRDQHIGARDAGIKRAARLRQPVGQRRPGGAHPGRPLTGRQSLYGPHRRRLDVVRLHVDARHGAVAVVRRPDRPSVVGDERDADSDVDFRRAPPWARRSKGRRRPAQMPRRSPPPTATAERFWAPTWIGRPTRLVLGSIGVTARAVVGVDEPDALLSGGDRGGVHVDRRPRPGSGSIRRRCRRG